MIILAIDPGFSFTGYCIIEKNEKYIALRNSGYLKLNPKKHLSERLATFHSFFNESITEYNVTDLALETPFLGKNAQNFLKLGYLRGALYLLAAHHSLTLHEFSPREVKQAVTGYGGASKDQVARIITQLFPQLKMPKKTDVTDAIAVGLCCLWQSPIKRMQLQ